MIDDRTIKILPYSRIVGQENLKLALELAYISNQIGGVLISGHRGTGKSTSVRAFSQMIYGSLPITLPINATEDRVVGGWNINELMTGKAVPQVGLLEQANEKMLYIDEVNLLDDHIVNIILDVTATSILVIQREGKDEVKNIKFTLVGTMNPEEGDLRPQLLDRFGLAVDVVAESDKSFRKQILRTVLEYEDAILKSKDDNLHPFFIEGYSKDADMKNRLERARKNLQDVEVSDEIVEKCVRISEVFKAEGHRADYIMALAARAITARDQRRKVTLEDVMHVAKLALLHRRIEQSMWTDVDQELLEFTINEK